MTFSNGPALILTVAAATLLDCGIALTQQPAPQPENAIVVNIAGFRNARGEVLCALFSSAADFPKKPERAVARTTAQISDRHAICEFKDIAPGTYAVSVVHDENSNGKLDTNLIGIPKEGVGASNNAKGHLGPPKFSAASFQFSGGRLDLAITIAYL